MRASYFPKEYIAYLHDEKIFIKGDELLNRGLTITSDGLPHYSKAPFDCTLLWWSGFLDRNQQKVYEGDICRMFIQSDFGSLVENIGIMRWDIAKRQFILHMPSTKTGVTYDATGVEVIGNELTHPDLMAKIDSLTK